MPRSRGGSVTPAGARVANPRPETAEKRQRILEAAMEIFAARGYDNGSLIEIGERAGISHAGVIHHFGSKDQLLIATLEYRDDSDVAQLEGSHIPDGAALFEHLIRTVELNSRRPGVVQLYTVLSADSVTEGHPAQQFFRSRFIGLRDLVRHALEDVAPEASAKDRADAASAIIGVMDGLQVQWLLDRDTVDMTAATTFAIRAILSRLTSNP